MAAGFLAQPCCRVYRLGGGCAFDGISVRAGAIPPRLAYCWAAGGVLCACWLIGADVIHVAFTNRNVWSIPLSLPLTALIVQAPLWALRFCFGWRWERQPDALATVEVRWSLADLFIGTALVALALGLARAAALSGDLHMAWVSFGEHACVLSLFGVAPAMLLLLRSRSWWFGAPLFLICAALGGCSYLAIQYGLNPDDFWFDAEFITSVTVPPFVSFAVGLALATGVARANGFRLVMGHPRPSGKAPADQPPCAVSTAKDL